MHDLGKGSRLSAGIAYNIAENNFYRNITKAEYQTNGRSFDFDTTFAGRATPVAGTAQNESSLTNFYNLQWNPFENYIATFKANLQLDDKTRLDIEPYYWYGDGSGGFGATLNESSAFQTSVYGAASKDLNGDGDRLDRVLFWRTSHTHTTRPGINLKLTRQIDNHKLAIGLWYERAEHRQTQPFVSVDASGRPMDLWATSNLVTGPNGKVLQGRDQLTISTARQIFIQDQISLLNDRLSLDVGVRLPEIQRDGKNFANNTPGNTVDYSVSNTYRDTLPQVGMRYRLNATDSVFANWVKNFRAPQNFVLYEPNQAARTRDLKAETSTNLDFGFRHQSKNLNLGATLFLTEFKNRMARVRDPDGTLRNHNAGDVSAKGIELEAGSKLAGGWSLYGSLSYNDTKQKNDFVTTNSANAVVVLPTKGKTFVDAPKWMTGLALRYDAGPWYGGAQLKHSSKRYATLTNDEAIDGFTTVDVNLGYRVAGGTMLKNAKVQLNVLNLFDEKYLAQITSTQTNAVVINGVGGTPNYAPGAPRFASVTFTADF
jgi:iron complex outermembrane receptor protein